VLKLSSNVSDVNPKVLKLSSEVSECKPLIAAISTEATQESALEELLNKVGRCRLSLSKPVLKGPLVSALEASIR